MGRLNLRCLSAGSGERDKVRRIPGQSNGRHKDGYKCRRYSETEKAASLRQQGVGGTSDRGGFPAEMQGLRASDHDSKKASGKKYQRNFVNV